MSTAAVAARKAETPTTFSRSRTSISARVGAHAPAVGLSLAALVLYLYMGLRNVTDGATGAYDLGIFHQAMLSWSHFHLPVATLKNHTEGLPSNFDLLADHFHPLLVVLVPTYWLWPHPMTLVVDQAVLLAASVVPLHVFARRRLGPVAAALVCVAYTTSIGMQSAVNFDFHEVALAPLLIMLVVERADAQRFTTATFCALLLLGVKEDLGLLLPFIGLLFAIWGQRRVGALLAGIGFLSFFVITQEVMPRLGTGTYSYWTYSSLGPTPVTAARSVLLHPIHAVQLATHGGTRRDSLANLFTPYGPLPFLSPVFVLAVPLLAERYLSDRSTMWSNHYDYELTLMPVIALALADTLGRLTRWLAPVGLRRRILVGSVLGLVLLGTAEVTSRQQFPLAVLAAKTGLHSPTRVHDLHVAVDLIPRGETVAGTDHVVNQFFGRNPVSLLDGGDPGTTWVVLETDELPFPWGAQMPGTTGSYSAEPSTLTADGYRLVRHLDDMDIYERSGAL